ncbi:hypothetical protein DFP72DRAFT_1064603 [Ephemerocybe angulata]|uniref:Uncharacterized protein n=1 Tax=Ephemerocybe angulata TaxID=980116 RepID=A0A8H6I6N6_9AGAR|nr:hypothetical protein DFP72DRAFT_1064603 [Tulosesus angulatus]
MADFENPYHALEADPNLLTRNKSTEPHTNEFSYRVGAVLLEAEFFIASPNVDYIPEPPLGNNRDVYLRADLRYGHDDYLLWPQPHFRGHLWLGHLCPAAPAPRNSRIGGNVTFT